MIFLSGSSGYLGSYIAEKILREQPDKLGLLVRAKNNEEAINKLWKSLQLHMDYPTFERYMRDRIQIFIGDLTQKKLGLSNNDWEKLSKETSSIIHCAASLNRKSEKTCMNVNLKGTLQFILLAQEIEKNHKLKRFSFVSTVAVAGHRKDEVVLEDDSVDWNRSDYDPYARTKKFCEHMLHELLPNTATTIFRPSIILGDSRFSKTTQFDMAQAFAFLLKFPILPFHRDWKLDIVPANFVGDSVVDIHFKENPKHKIYHLSAGKDSLTYEQILDGLHRHGVRKPPLAPALSSPFYWLVELLASGPRKLTISVIGKLMKVFLPYLTFNTVFDNTRITEELGSKPAIFTDYAYSLYTFVTENEFKFPYEPLPKKERS